MAGGQWAVLQSVAWARMLAEYSQQSGSVAQGLERTFDGQHPCNLCRAIQTGKSKEHKESSPVPGTKEDGKVKAWLTEAPTPAAERVIAAAEFAREGESEFTSRAEAPPTPPPRRALPAA